MEFVEAIRDGNSCAFLSKISKIHRKQNDHFQEIVRNLELKFEELKNFDDCEFEFGDADVGRNIKEPKRKRAGIADSSKLLPNESVCTSDLKEPLCSSTPTESSSTSVDKEDPVKKPNVTSETNACAPKTPPNKLICPLQSESVKKRIEEFEKRAAAAASSASKIPIPTPVKKNIAPTVIKNLTVKLVKEESVKPNINIQKIKNSAVKTHIYVEKTEAMPINSRLTRNTSKVLQEKNTNIKSAKEKVVDPPIRKTAVKKASVDEVGRKKEEALRKAAEKQKRAAAMKERHEKEKEAKIQAVQKIKEEKLLLLKKKQFGTTKNVEINEDKLEKKVLESYNIEDVVDGASTDEEDNPTKKIPPWATKENRRHQLCAQAWLDKKKTVYLWFYDRSLKYPKVEELFSVAVKTRPRTSSAVWNNSSICF